MTLKVKYMGEYNYVPSVAAASRAISGSQYPDYKLGPIALTKIFVLGDIIAFLTQRRTLVQQTASSFSTGETVIEIGLIIQVIFFGLFILISVLFHVRLVKSGFAERYTRHVPWRRHMHALYIGSVFIFIRCSFRLIEYDQGTTGTLLQHEYWVYIFDAAMMLIVMAVFSWIYPVEVTELLRVFYGPDSGTEFPLHG
ncbi:RTA1-domain-containing protein [Aspergillus saccharolyticus JOP 1030-1]|uniref:RTA1-domain-containing protein n=1 Tax=Aspergillus saccharolyticus JOP 1030-1 TaxID=1450539 RepID=A0A318ZJ29_9EURO|nr:RTA1-domain-containing protein [Aspergillus saccharolyticus JOP 1030-1]PYH40258.1 RTA1-domain-containing protein [Aspergillus saccharolyticus JOP 1030-1]